MDVLTRLAAIEDIKQLKARYFRGADTKDKGLFRSVFAEDATADYRGSENNPRTGSSIDHNQSPTQSLIVGADEITDAVFRALAPLVTVHHGCMPEITILDDHRASGIWPMVDRIQPAYAASFTEGIGWGHYHETYEKIGGEWKIKTLRLTRLRVEVR